MPFTKPQKKKKQKGKEKKKKMIAHVTNKVTID